MTLFFKCYPHAATFQRESPPYPRLTGSTATFPSIFPFLLGICFARANHFFISSLNFPSRVGIEAAHSRRIAVIYFWKRNRSAEAITDARLTPGRGYRFNWAPTRWSSDNPRRNRVCSEFRLLNSGKDRFRRRRKTCGDHFGDGLGDCQFSHARKVIANRPQDPDPAGLMWELSESGPLAGWFWVAYIVWSNSGTHPQHCAFGSFSMMHLFSAFDSCIQTEAAGWHPLPASRQVRCPRWCATQVPTAPVSKGFLGSVSRRSHPRSVFFVCSFALNNDFFFTLQISSKVSNSCSHVSTNATTYFHRPFSDFMNILAAREHQIGSRPEF